MGELRMWAGSVWGLFGLSISSFYTMLSLPADSEWRPALTYAGIVFFLLSAVVLFWPLLHRENRVLVSAKLKHPKKWIAELVEPSHIVILGLLIALAGAIWQWRRAPPIDPAIASLQTEIANLRASLAEAQKPAVPVTKLGQVTASSSPAQAKPGFTTRTVRELRALYEGRTRLQADAFIADDKGKLIEVEGSVQNVDSGMAFLEVSKAGINADYVECRFSPEWNVKLSTFRQGDKMRIQGVIGPNQNGAQIYLQDCKII
jgi:hypothetical protein